MKRAKSRQEKKRGEQSIYRALAEQSSSQLMRLCMLLSMLEREWPSIVGERLASRSAPVAFAEGVLTVAVDGQAALQDMNFKKGAILRHIRAKIRLEAGDIRTEIGRPRRGTPQLPARHRSAPTPRRKRLDPAAESAHRAEIVSRHGDIDPRLADVLARCRAALREDGGGKQ